MWNRLVFSLLFSDTSHRGKLMVAESHQCHPANYSRLILQQLEDFNESWIRGKPRFHHNKQEVRFNVSSHCTSRCTPDDTDQLPVLYIHKQHLFLKPQTTQIQSKQQELQIPNLYLVSVYIYINATYTASLSISNTKLISTRYSHILSILIPSHTLFPALKMGNEKEDTKIDKNTNSNNNNNAAPILQTPVTPPQTPKKDDVTKDKDYKANKRPWKDVEKNDENGGPQLSPGKWLGGGGGLWWEDDERGVERRGRGENEHKVEGKGNKRGEEKWGWNWLTDKCLFCAWALRKRKKRDKGLLAKNAKPGQSGTAMQNLEYSPITYIRSNHFFDPWFIATSRYQQIVL